MFAAAAAKSLQPCPTLCDPTDSSPPGSPVPGILQPRTRVGCHFLLQCVKVKSESEVAQSCLTLHDPMDCSPPTPPSMGFSRQEYWSGVGLPSPIYVWENIYFPNITDTVTSFLCVLISAAGMLFWVPRPTFNVCGQ